MKNKMKLAILFVFSLAIIGTLFACTPVDDECNGGHHAFGEWQPDTTDPSVFCHKRTYSSVCTSCGEIGTAKGGMGWHEDVTERLEPTCIAEGYEKSTCLACDYNDMFTIPINPSAHQYDDTYCLDTMDHWKECLLCDAVASMKLHEANEEQYCETCGYFIGPSIGIVYEISEDGSYAMVTDYLSGISSIEIAQYYEGIPVKVIKADAFKDEGISSIIIPDGVATIESGAFMGCTWLKSITLPDSVTTIGDNAFKGCTRLSELTLSCNVATIGSGAFEGCTALKEIIIPDGVETIGDQAFYNCTSITKIDFGNTVTSIGSSAFENCSSISDVVIPDSVVSIGDGAFRNCSQLKKLSGCGGLKNVGRYAFDNCHEYLYFVSLQGKYVVDHYNEWVILIEFLAKNWWDGHQIIDKTTIIASGAYDQSYYLTSIVIPENVVSICDDAFADCQSLTSIYYMGTPDAWANVTIGEDNDYLLNAEVEYHQQND
ncbi:MAG: leucine-rich repeat domain-containing protein [Clostridia bacterium]|nr:leucine-rich repeat domain-containing protein [Clostridia bacterium]